MISISNTVNKVEIWVIDIDRGDLSQYTGYQLDPDDKTHFWINHRNEINRVTLNIDAFLDKQNATKALVAILTERVMTLNNQIAHIVKWL